MSSLTGALLGGTYRVGNCLGQGGMGAVYEAVHEALGRRVAIKVLLDQGQISPEALTRFQREAMAAAQLGHPNIIQVTDFRTNPGEPPFIVMERLEGESMENAIRREGRLAPSRVSRIAQQVLEALMVAHRAGIVHRDIKPANLFLTQIPGVGEVVKVIDFGIAKLQTQGTNLTAAGASMGTPLYAAPELLWGTQSDARADIYSLGATMYHALTGRPPIVADTLPQFMSQVRDTFPEPVYQQVPGLDSQLGQVVMFALAKEPGSRYPSAEAMRDALQGGARISISGDGSGTAQTAQVPPMQAIGPGPMQGTPQHAPSPYGSAAPPAAFAQSVAGTPQPHSYVAGPSGPPNAQNAQLGYTPSYAAPPAYQAQQHSMQAAPQKKSSAGLWLGLGGLALFLLLAGGGVAGWLVYASDAKPAATAAGVASGSATNSATGTPASTAGAVLPTSTVADSNGRTVIVIPTASSRTTPTAAPTATAVPTSPPPDKPPSPTAGKIKQAYCFPSQAPTYGDTTPLKASIDRRSFQIGQCAIMACYTSGAKSLHEGGDDYTSTVYTMNVDSRGTTSGLANAGSESCPRLDTCMRNTVFTSSSPLAPPLRAGQLQVSCKFIRSR